MLLDHQLYFFPALRKYWNIARYGSSSANLPLGNMAQMQTEKWGREEEKIAKGEERGWKTA
ncbi:uncharacterized protein CLUP02_16082 [Colletotrichum lupini]|uniref:Uncharacterized protein n=1 Tax=Colletotrichum lupini TaxID=145971 RepID=A0A9Q8T7G1_9PEZI|nr:uncharacterized protein CLUP02_16082 [Colletotrichum lupini]UQC90552.1 hypothetical protein CLUP02_16082 [Colletotrichum lupini]